jgi:single-strand DNA-binding protein
MASFNRVVVMGNLGQDPELRYTQNQNAVCTLNVATTDYRTSPDGQKQEFTEWHRIVVWGRQAENASKYLSKGRAVLVEGRLQTRSWEDKQGQKRYTTEIIAQNVQFVGGGSGASRNDQQQQMGGGQQQGNGYSQQQQSSDYNQPQGNMGEPQTPGLDDIPF